MQILHDLRAYYISPLQSLVYLSLLLLVAKNLVKQWISYFNAPPYPPGPRRRTFIGSRHDIPMTKPWVTYSNWSKKYGNVIHVQDYSKHIVVVNSLEDAVELFEKRAKTYSSRPTNIMAFLMGWDFNTGMRPYGDDWRRQRRIFQQLFRKDESLKYRPVQIRKINDMLRSLLTSPENFTVHYKTVSAAIVMATLYDYDISPDNDHYVSLSGHAVQKLVESIFPGAVLVNAFPFLRYLPSWFPGAGFKRFAQECKILTEEMKNIPLKFVQKNMELGKGTTAITAALLERNIARGNSSEGEDDIKCVAATSFAAGADTTTSALGTFFYAMTCNPDVQKKAQEEIDRVIGTHRLPTYEDSASLPYAEALYREIMRWKPVAPLGIGHETTEDDIYQGYTIPKGTTVYGNIWAMTRDETLYKNPELFCPERFFSDGELNDDDLSLVFGFGRRVCPGRHMAKATVWLACVSILATFDITTAKDEFGNEIPVSGEYSDGAISHPLPFRCSVTPRSEEARRLIMETRESN